MVPFGLTTAAPLAGCDAIVTEFGSMLPNNDLSFARTLMMIGVPTLVDVITSFAIGGKRLTVGSGVMGIAGAFAGGQVRRPVMLPFTSMNLNMRSGVGSCVI